MTGMLALWAHPRARSSAFCRMMHERGDHVVKDEPFARHYYFSDERVSGRRTDVPPDPDHRFDLVVERLVAEATTSTVFVKDHAYHVISRADRNFVRRFRNTFLVRDPAQSLPSLHARMPDFTIEETGYTALVALFRLACRHADAEPVVIDSADLVRDPEATIAAYCRAIGISFRPDALSWASGIPPEMDADWGGWYGHLETSRGIRATSNPGYASIDDDAHLAATHRAVMPSYLELREHRLRVPAPGS